MVTANYVRYASRRQAGQALVGPLLPYMARNHVVVLALPRGGVPVGYEVARALHAPLDVFIVRKLGVPFQPELAMGALASGGVLVVDEHVTKWTGVSQDALEDVKRKAEAEIHRQERVFRGGRPQVDLTGRTVILVDDGLATGATMRAAVTAVRRLHPARIVVAAPVGSREACEDIERLADELVCLSMPREFSAVGEWYEDYSQISDSEVADLLNDTRTSPTRPGDEEC